MTCDFRAPSWCLAAFGLVVLSSCTTEVEVIGVVRSVANGCAETEQVYVFEVPENGGVPADIVPEWCTVMGSDDRVTCFLTERNGNARHGNDLPRELEHTDVPDNHPDVECWAVEAAEWDAAWDGTDEDYHPIWSNDWYDYE